MQPRPPLARPTARDAVAGRVQAVVATASFACAEAGTRVSLNDADVTAVVTYFISPGRRDGLSVCAPHDAGMALRAVRDALWGTA